MFVCHLRTSWLSWFVVIISRQSKNISHILCWTKIRWNTSNIWKEESHPEVLKVNFSLCLFWKSNCSVCIKNTYILHKPSCLHLHPGYLFSYLQNPILQGILTFLNQFYNVLNMKWIFNAFFLKHRTTLLVTTFLCQIGIFTIAINGTPNQSKGILIQTILLLSLTRIDFIESIRNDSFVSLCVFAALLDLYWATSLSCSSWSVQTELFILKAQDVMREKQPFWNYVYFLWYLLHL